MVRVLAIIKISWKIKWRIRLRTNKGSSSHLLSVSVSCVKQILLVYSNKQGHWRTVPGFGMCVIDPRSLRGQQQQWNYCKTPAELDRASHFSMAAYRGGTSAPTRHVGLWATSNATRRRVATRLLHCLSQRRPTWLDAAVVHNIGDDQLNECASFLIGVSCLASCTVGRLNFFSCTVETMFMFVFNLL